MVGGDPLSLEGARQARAAALIGDLLPWTDPARAGASSLEARTGESEWTAAYEILEGANAGGILLQTRRPGLEPGTWTTTRRVRGEAEALEERFQTIDPADGSLVLAHSLNFERGVRVEMTPAPVAVPARIEPGQTLSREMRIRLPLLDNPKRLREKGSALSEMTYLDDQRVNTAAGRFDAAHLREVFTSRFAAATAVRTIDRWFARGGGLVAERWVEEVRVLGVVVERTRFAIRVLPPTAIGQPEPAAGTPESSYRPPSGDLP